MFCKCYSHNLLTIIRLAVNSIDYFENEHCLPNKVHYHLLKHYHLLIQQSSSQHFYLLFNFLIFSLNDRGEPFLTILFSISKYILPFKCKSIILFSDIASRKICIRISFTYHHSNLWLKKLILHNQAPRDLRAGAGAKILITSGALYCAPQDHMP